MQELENQPDIAISLNMSTKREKRKLERLITAILLFVQISSPLPFVGWNSWSISPAQAVLYSPDTKVPRTGELALRRAIPANTSMKAIQVIFYCLIEYNDILTLTLIRASNIFLSL